MGSRIQLVLAIQRVGNEGHSKPSCHRHVHDDVSKFDWYQRYQLLLPHHLQVSRCLQHFNVSLCHRYLWHCQDVHNCTFHTWNEANSRSLPCSGFSIASAVASSLSSEVLVPPAQCSILRPLSPLPNLPVRQLLPLVDTSLL